MQWNKLGLIWTPNGDSEWAKSHAAIPVAYASSDREWHVYLSIRNDAGKSHIGRIALDVSGAPHFRKFQSHPVLALGTPGAFDDCGVMPSWIVEHNGALWMYYVGWNVPATVSYHLSIGLAISEDRGATWKRYSQGPIMGRSPQEPFFVTTPCVLKEGNAWRMWYSSCSEWRQIGGRWEPRYSVKYAESSDGIEWRPTGDLCIDAGKNGAVARPFVYRENGGYRMLYSHRLLTGYRDTRQAAYRLGYAESADGIAWERKDEDVGIAAADEGWDSEMVTYCWMQPHGDRTYLLYNGNGFGRSGLGIAQLAAGEAKPSPGASLSDQRVA